MFIRIREEFKIPGKTPKQKITIDKSKKKRKNDLDTFSKKIAPKIDPSIRNKCLKCRGTKNLCGKQRCPVLAKYYSQLDNEGKSFNTKHLDGNSPPSVFIGRYNYPKVNVGPLVPPEHGDTSIYSQPQKWYGDAEIGDILKFRGNLARGKKKLKTGIEITPDLDRDVQKTRILALFEKPTQTEVSFDKKLTNNLKLDYKSQPYGPSAKLTEFDYSHSKSQRQLEKVFYDDDLKAEKAVKKLYEKNVSVSKIQDIFMVGGTGLGQNRRFVPTRHSITAVDDIIGKKLREEAKNKRLIDEYEVYSAKYLDNQWLVILTPTPWQYELVEAFYPETTWNPSKNQIAMFGDHEGLKGRKEYASLGGCYYSARLAVGEKLREKNRQAGAIVLREARPGYILPVGVWLTRESVRNALKGSPQKFDTKKQTLNYIDQKMDIRLNTWLDVSELLSQKEKQKTLGEF
ncbi:hypothetical protein C9439_04335 [archaeon SCG-AAA382B04]|nr:hypothetical protein C9439_04335 [archaeon SCG-AAA382B04]